MQKRKKWENNFGRKFYQFAGSQAAETEAEAGNWCSWRNVQQEGARDRTEEDQLLSWRRRLGA